MHYRYLLCVALMTLFLVLSCTKPPDYPNEPVIEFLSMTKNTMVQGRSIDDDFLRMTISFTDGDGDLGSNNNEDTTKVYIADTRRDIPDIQPISIPMVPELGTGNGISGEATFVVNTSCCIYPIPASNCEPLAGFPTDTIFYEIYIVDRAGNKSNVVRADPVILLCQ